MPVPFFARLVEPVLSSISTARLMLPVAVRVRVRAPVWLLKPRLPVLVKVSGPVPEVLIVPPLVPIEKRRSVLTAGPV